MRTANLDQKKARLRTECVARRGSLDPDWVASAGQAILRHLLSLEEYAEARVIHTYVAAKNAEVPTDDFIRLSLEQGRRVTVPVMQAGTRALRHAEISDLEQVRPGPWGLREPPAGHPHWIEDPAVFDLVVVPGLAFDERGGRLGFGGGYYDRFLAPVRAPKVGLTYACLLMRELPVTARDVPVDIVVTELCAHRTAARA